MKILKLKAENIFSLQSVELDLNNKGLVLVNGYSFDEGSTNGSGKSSLTSKAIIWILYGKTVSGIRADNVINSFASPGSPSFGELTIDSSGSIYKIIRGRMRPKGLLLNYVGPDGPVDLTDKLEASTQHKIEKLIGYSFDEYIRMFFFGQGLTEVFVNQGQSFRKALIEKILPFETIEQYKEKVYKYNTILYSKHAEISRDTGILTSRIVDASTRIVRMKKQQQTDVENFAKAQANIFSLPAFGTLEEVDKSVEQTNESINALMAKRANDIYNEICTKCNQFIKRSKHGFFLPNDEQKLNELVELRTKLSYQKNIVKNSLNVKENWDKEIAIEKELIDKLTILRNELSLVQQTALEISDLFDKWCSILSTDIRMSLLMTACPMLSDYTNLFLSKLKNSQINVLFKVEGKDLMIYSKSKTGASNFESLSGGEQQIVNFAVGLALGSLSRYIKGEDSIPSLMIFDEPFTMLDERNCEAVVDFLTNNKLADTILLVSNDTSLTSLIPNRITVTKKNGVSTLQ